LINNKDNYGHIAYTTLNKADYCFKVLLLSIVERRGIFLWYNGKRWTYFVVL